MTNTTKEAAARRPPIERFKRAVRDGDAKTVRALLEQHEEVRSSLDAPIFAFDSPALVAVSNEHIDVNRARVLHHLFGAP